jgi:hypothetical protein
MHKLNGPISTKVLSFIILAVFSSAMVGCGRTQAAPPEVRVTPSSNKMSPCMANGSRHSTVMSMPKCDPRFQAT